MKKVQIIAFSALFIALEVILTRFLSIQTPILRIGFTFLPVALSAILLGPVISGIIGVAADILGMLIFPSGVYFPGFTLSAFISGFIYGIFMYKKEASIIRTILAIITVIIVVDIVLNSLWLSILMHKAFIGLLPLRIVKSLLMLPIQIILIQFIWKGIRHFVPYSIRSN